MKRSAHILGGLLVTQVVVGALNVWLDEYELLILAHLALGTLLWAASMNTVFQLSPARTRAAAPPRAVTA